MNLGEMSIARKQALATFQADHPNMDGVTLQQAGRWMKRRLDWVPGELQERILDDIALMLPDPYGRSDSYTDSHLQPIQWGEFWTDEHDEAFLVDPLIPGARLVALYAAGKTGKSLLTLEVAAALATGTPCLNTQVLEPRPVVYIDQEMTQHDLADRLDTLGYGEDSGVDLSNLHYYQMQSLAPLDTPEGAKDLWNIWQRHEPELLVIDTVARVVQGEENSADTYRALYRESLLQIKATGTSILRIDHAGKDTAKGQRGSSAKNDDVDVVWRLDKINDNSLALVADRKRMGWVPHYVGLTRKNDTQGRLRHMPEVIHLTPDQQAIVAELDEKGAPHDMGRRAARKDYGMSVSNTDWANVSRFRKSRGPLWSTGTLEI